MAGCIDRKEFVRFVFVAIIRNYRCPLEYIVARITVFAGNSPSPIVAFAIYKHELTRGHPSVETQNDWYSFCPFKIRCSLSEVIRWIKTNYTKVSFLSVPSSSWRHSQIGISIALGVFLIRLLIFLPACCWIEAKSGHTQGFRARARARAHTHGHTRQSREHGYVPRERFEYLRGVGIRSLSFIILPLFCLPVPRANRERSTESDVPLLRFLKWPPERRLASIPVR